MARDRKKAKQRRARQERQAQRSAAGRGGPSASRESREPPLDPERRPTTDPPEPIEEASADVELAKQAELGMPVDEVDEPGPGDEKAGVYEDELSDDSGGHGVLAELVDRDQDLDIDEEPDPELEEQAEAAAKATGRAPRRDAKAAKRSDGNRVFAFLRACWAELQRVQWPDRRAVAQATTVVLSFVIIAGTYLGLMDYIWSKVITALLDL